MLLKPALKLEFWCIAALAFISIAIIQQIVGVSATYVGETVAWSATNALSVRISAALPALGYELSQQRQSWRID